MPPPRKPSVIDSGPDSAPEFAFDEPTGLHEDPTATVNRRLKAMWAEHREFVKRDQFDHDRITLEIVRVGGAVNKLETKVDAVGDHVGDLRVGMKGVVVQLDQISNALEYQQEVAQTKEANAADIDKTDAIVKIKDVADRQQHRRSLIYKVLLAAVGLASAGGALLIQQLMS